MRQILRRIPTYSVVERNKCCTLQQNLMRKIMQMLSPMGEMQRYKIGRRTQYLARRHGHGGNARGFSQNSDDDNEKDGLEMEWTVVKHERPERLAIEETRFSTI